MADMARELQACTASPPGGPAGGRARGAARTGRGPDRHVPPGLLAAGWPRGPEHKCAQRACARRGWHGARAGRATDLRRPLPRQRILRGCVAGTPAIQAVQRAQHRMAAPATRPAAPAARSGRCGRILLWALLVAGTVASLVANVAVAQPTATGRISP